MSVIIYMFTFEYSSEKICRAYLNFRCQIFLKTFMLSVFKRYKNLQKDYKNISQNIESAIKQIDVIQFKMLNNTVLQFN